MYAETAIVDYRLSIKENKGCFPFLFAGNQWKFAAPVFRLQKTNRRCHFLLVPFSVYGIPETC
jgi:hypothetical protein